MLNQEQRKGTAKRGLGRGLASLLPSAFEEEFQKPTGEVPSVENVVREKPMSSVTEKSPYFFLHVDDLVPNPNQPRKTFDEGALDELSQSIAVHGILSPIVVRQKGPHYEIIAGERRWRAAQKAGLKRVPVLLKEVGEKAQYQLALIENIQRRDLTPMEEAIGYEHLMDAYGWTQEKVAEQVGKSRSSVANCLRLLKLPQSVQDFLNEGKLSLGHAKVLLALEQEDEIKALARKAVEEDLSVRQLEKLVGCEGDTETQSVSVATVRERVPMQRDPLIVDLERRLENVLKTRIVLTGNGRTGEMRIHFESTNQLNEIADRLMGAH